MERTLAATAGAVQAPHISTFGGLGSSIQSANGGRTSVFGSCFQSCQARVGLWKQLEIKGGVIELFESLGQGAYAEVYRGRALGVDCAIKKFRRTASEKHKQEALREIELTASLDHPCTLRILAWTREPLQTMTELCRGDLVAFYKDKIEELPYSESEALRLLQVGLFAAPAYRFLARLRRMKLKALPNPDRKVPLECSTSILLESSIVISSQATSWWASSATRRSSQTMGSRGLQMWRRQ